MAAEYPVPNNEYPPIFPVCLVIDVSGSMLGTPIDAVNTSLPKLQQVLSKDPSVEEIARISIVTFSDSAQCVMPLTDMREAQIPHLGAGGLTNYTAALNLARESIEQGLRSLGKGTRFYKPVIFFISDGLPNVGGDWRSAKKAITDPGYKFRAEVVSFGMGEADRQTIGAVSTRHAFFAKDEDLPRAVEGILDTILGSIKTTSGSFGGGGGGLVVDYDPSQFTPLPTNEV
jgi:uncharacterized protein YegL